MASGSFSPQIRDCSSVNIVIKPINGDQLFIENSNISGSVTKVEENLANMMNMMNTMQQQLDIMRQQLDIMQQQMQLLMTVKNMMPVNAAPPPPNNNVVPPPLNPLETTAMNPPVNDDGCLSNQCRDSYPSMLQCSPDPNVAEDCLRFAELLQSSTSDQMASINHYCHTTDLSLYRGRKYSNEFGGFGPLNPLATNKNSLTLGRMDWRKTSCCSLKGNEAIIEQKSDIEEVIPAHKFEEDDLTDDSVAGQTFPINGFSSTNNEMQADTVAFETIAADITPAADDFFVDNGKFDLDCPTEGFNSIAEAIEGIRQRKFVIVVDDEDRENEGDLIMAASLVTPKDMAFLVKHGTGIVCVSMKEENLECLQLPLMVAQKENEEKLSAAFTVSVDAKEGTTTGVSAKDRAKTILTLASCDSEPEDFKRPGHIFPLKCREGGVLKRAGDTEASVDLAVIAGLDPVGVLCEIVDDDDDSMARLPKLREFAKKENLKLISIADLIR